EWPNNCVVVQHTKGDPTGSVRVLQNLLSDYGLPPDGYRMHLVRLHRDDVISMLRIAGLLSLEPSTVFAQTALCEEHQELPVKASAKARIMIEAPRMKRAGEIPEGIEKTDFARILAGKFGVSMEYVRNRLNEWGLWPISAIRRDR